MARDKKLDQELEQLGQDVETVPLFEFFELVPRLQRLLDAQFSDLDPPLTFGQYRTLHRVAEGHDTPTAMSSVATLSMPAISERLDMLVRKGLLRRRVNRSDRRSTTLSLTPLGREILREGHGLMERLSSDLMDQMTPASREVFGAGTHSIAATVTERLRRS